MKASVTKKRLDDLVVERGLANTLLKARALILAGEILVGKKQATKAGENVAEEASITLAHEGPKYVSRGGIKLAGALEYFEIDPKGWECLDVGASTGGFTDCLLQRGARHICTIDVGRGQLDPKVRNHPQVIWKESFHVDNLSRDTFDRLFDLAVIDVSFISLRKVLPYVVPCLQPEGLLLALIKPQFEALKKDILKGGVLRDETKRQQIISDMVRFAEQEFHLASIRTNDSVLTGPKGNREVFIFGTRT